MEHGDEVVQAGGLPDEGEETAEMNFVSFSHESFSEAALEEGGRVNSRGFNWIGGAWIVDVLFLGDVGRLAMVAVRPDDELPIEVREP